MKSVAVLFATREGQTKKIAEYTAERLRAAGHEAESFDVASLGDGFTLTKHSAAILAASVHASRFEPEMLAFMKRHRNALTRIPSAFLSVSLTEAAASDENGSPERRAAARAAVERVMDELFAQAGWGPNQQLSVAGALKYSAYGALKRFVMKHIARSMGFHTVVSRDYELTDWRKLGRFVEDFVAGATAHEA